MTTLSSAKMAPSLEVALVFWAGTTLRKFVLESLSPAMVIWVPQLETWGGAKRFTRSVPSMTPATI